MTLSDASNASRFQTWVKSQPHFLIRMIFLSISCQCFLLCCLLFQSSDIFPLTACFSAHKPVFLCHTNPCHVSWLVFKVRLNTPLNATIQGSNETNQTTCATARKNSTKKPTKIISIYIYILESYTQAC